MKEPEAWRFSRRLSEEITELVLPRRGSQNVR